MVFSRNMKTYIFSLSGGSATQIYHDSTRAIPIGGDREYLFRDYRKGREGWWVVSLDGSGREKSIAKRIAPANSDLAGPSDMHFILYRKEGDELRRVWTSTGVTERIGKALPGATYLCNVSMDGKNLLWEKLDTRSKYMLVTNVFE